MSRPADNRKTIDGPFGLKISSAKLALLPGSGGFRVNPSYADPAGIVLSTVRHRAESFKLMFGGVLSDLPAEEVAVSTQGDVATTYDTNGDARVDAFFIKNYTIDLPAKVKIFGVVIGNAKAVISDLSNHPTLLKLASQASQASAGWLGSIKLSGSDVGFAALPELVVTPVASGGNAVEAIYDIASGNLQIDLARLSYNTPQFAFSLNQSQLNFENASKSVALKAAGEVSLPGLGLSKLTGDLDLKVSQSEQATLKASIATPTTLTPLAIKGKLAVDHNFSSKSGSITLADAEVMGIAANGSLSYGEQSLSGSLSLSNNQAAPLNLNVAGFALTPLSGTASFDYNWGSTTPGGSLNIKDARFSLGFAERTLTFSGDLSLNLTPTGAPSFASANLKLESDLDVNLDGFKLKLLANDPLAPIKLNLMNSNGTLVPSLSGKVEFTDLGGLALSIPDGGISYGPNGWSLQDVQLNLERSLDLGPIRLGDQASARYQNGLLTVNTDLSVNLGSFNLALKPLGTLVSDWVTPVTAPVVQVYKTDLDLNSIALVRDGMASVRDSLGVDLPTMWGSIVNWIEAVPGNPYKDQKLTAGELLDFVSYRAFDLVQKNPKTAPQLFKQAFNAELPSWLLALPQNLDYSLISMSATVAKLEAINQIAAALSRSTPTSGTWIPMPMQFQLAANGTQPALTGGAAEQQRLQAQLRQLSTDLAALDQLLPTKPVVAGSEIKMLPLQFDYGFKVPLIERPLETLLSMITQKPFDLVRSDFSLKSALELNAKLPLAELSAAVPPLAAALKAANVSLDLRAGLGADLALSLGLTSTTKQLASISKDPGNVSATADALLKTFAGKDPITGQSIGLFVGQSPGKDMLTLSPFVQAGIGLGRFGVDALAYGRADGTVNVNLTSNDGSNRLYLNDALTGKATLPGLTAKGSLKGQVGVKIDTFFGDANPKFDFDIIKDAQLLAIRPLPQSQALRSTTVEFPSGLTPFTDVPLVTL